MLTMRDFITDQRLHKALDEVESWMGYVIPAVPMPLQHQEYARGSMKFNEETGSFEFLYIANEPLNQAGCCHELAHLMLWINGAVIKYDYSLPIPAIFYTPTIRLFLHEIWLYMQHVPVFNFVKGLGYDEIPDYASHAPSLVALIRQNQFDPAMNVPSWDPEKDKVRCQAGVLVKHLALPMAEETRDALKKVAQEKIPQSLELPMPFFRLLGSAPYLGGKSIKNIFRKSII